MDIDMESLKSVTGNTFRCPLDWSCPCDVNSSASFVPTPDYKFLEEARRANRAMKDKEYTTIDIESSMETQRLLDHDSLAQNYQEHQEITILPRYTTNATLQISATPVDEPISLELDNAAEKKQYDLDTLQTKVLHSKYSVYIPTYRSTEERKVDENGNALHQNPATKAKKKKIQTDKNVVVLSAERVEGHRSDIINDVDKLIRFIRGDDGDAVSGGGKGGGHSQGSGGRSSNTHKSKQLHKQHASSEDGPSNRKKQRANSSKGKDARPELKKSNSLGEISTATLDEFAFVGVGGPNKDSEGKVLLRHKTPGDRPKERRSWGNVEPPPFQILSSNASTENLETTDNWVVTKPKKKSKKRRNSVSSSGRRPTSSSESNAKHANRAPSPDPRSKLARSVPHSERSNDSSDADSVHSLPIDGLNAPISYADIAKNGEKLKDKKVSPEKPGTNKENSNNEAKQAGKIVEGNFSANCRSLPLDFKDASFPAMPVDVFVSDPKSFPIICSDVNEDTIVSALPPPDVNSIRNFPAISAVTINNKNYSVVEKTNVKNSGMDGKCRNVSPVSKGATKSGSASDVDVKFTATNNAGWVNSNIQNDLTIIHSNEKESIQFNAQMLPPNIPDVQTIEKMHFLNCPPPAPHQPPPPNSPTASLPAGSPTPAGLPVPARTVPDSNDDCDSSERTISESDHERPPPVVILSGLAGNKDVTGLVFGFDVNEQLLNEDICENFVARYMAPEAFDSASLNHDKIVNFIGTAWEAIVNQSNGKVQYYKEES